MMEVKRLIRQEGRRAEKQLSNMDTEHGEETLNTLFQVDYMKFYNEKK